MTAYERWFVAVLTALAVGYVFFFSYFVLAGVQVGWLVGLGLWVSYLALGWLTARWWLRKYRRLHPIATLWMMSIWWMAWLAEAVVWVAGSFH